MFNKYFIQDNSSVIEAARITERSNRELGKKLESISNAEIQSKDRVDIPLKEYLQMRERIEKLEAKYAHMGKLVSQLGIPVEVIDDIKRDTIKVTHCDDVRDFTRTYRIEFDVDASPDLMKWRYEY